MRQRYLGGRLGRVVAKQANFAQVQLEDGLRLLCTRRARLKKTGQSVWVGDRVTIEEIDPQAGQGVITAIAPRQTTFTRPPVANASQILLLFALAQPDLDPWQLSRFLLCVEATPALKPLVCLNKCDLVSVEVQQMWQARLATWGYPPLLLTVQQQQGYDPLYPCLAGQITLLAGPSGVGKSSLIRSLLPEVAVRVAAVSGKLQRGRHTTRHVELYELPGQGWLVDSPGFNKPELTIAPQQLAAQFPEIRQRQQQASCQFSDCWHREEPGCVVRGDWERYAHYLRFLEEALQAETLRQRQPDAEAAFKLKMRPTGRPDYEPRLDAKKYRRRSRRQRHQLLEQWQVTAEDDPGEPDS
ncbi:MAG: small ribosomal subunit biogenesis GTPase RsgA [Cyanobacteria bacterium P01_G01_bin.54]